MKLEIAIENEWLLVTVFLQTAVSVRGSNKLKTSNDAETELNIHNCFND